MITSKTYYGQAGLNYVQSSELSFAKIIVVKREGVQHDKYISGSTTRTFIHTEAEGKISFPTPFGENGEKVFVLFDMPNAPEPVDPPGVCIPVVIPDVTFSDTIVGVSYSKVITLTGTPPFVLSGITKPSWMTITNSGNNITHTGTPDAEGLQLVEYDVTNCSGSTASLNKTFNVYTATTNFYVSNLSTGGVSINSISGIGYVIQTGSLPIGIYSGITGVHGDYTGKILFNISGITFPFSLSLKVNSIDIETIPVIADGDYEFSVQTYLSTDEIIIILS